ncbi:MAG TPA: M1 family aminopeptidase [Bacteroidales bacterium]|nr:M1 family aminopeptidase [Bacteroidales bacterium]
MKSSVLFKLLLCLAIFPAGFSHARPRPVAVPRLYSDTIDVVHYGIHLTEINSTLKTLKGYTEVQFTPVINGISALPLELISLTVDSVIMNGSAIPNYSHSGTLLRIPLLQVMNTGDTATATVYYHGTPFTDPSNWGGVHFSGEYVFNLGVGFDSDPHNLGKAWFPCIDDFHDRALYDVYIRVSNDKKAVGGGNLVDITDHGDNTSTWHWKTEHTLPSYLISFTTGQYELKTDIYNGMSGPVPITWYARPADTSKISATFVHLHDILQNFETHFGPYPFERVGYSSTAQGAMEHASNISYPYSGWNGNTSLEWWYGHELSHMWFGDKVTCASAEDMWINEGWARWCESLLLGGLYGESAYKDDMRSKLKNVLQSTHITDGGYYALYGIPSGLTYGSTVYDKGGQVVHTLRNYLGDSLFFGGVKAFLNEYAYHDMSSENLRDFLGNYTGIDLTDFFETWVFTPGFPHFSVDSFSVQPVSGHYDVTVYVRQKSKGTTLLANSNHLEVTFMNDQWQQYSDTLIFSGLTGSKVFSVPFEPVAVMADLNQKISDATTDYAATIKTTGELEFPDTYVKVITGAVPDSAFVRITHNWVEPDSLKTPLTGLRLSDSHYWKVEGIFPEGFKAKAKFFYSKSNLDNNLLLSSADSLVLLYRPGPAYEWYGVPFTQIGGWNIGFLEAETLARGEYTLAVWDAQYAGQTEKNQLRNLHIFPNPARNSCSFETTSPSPCRVTIYNSTGNRVKAFMIKAGNNTTRWDTRNEAPGLYFVHLSGEGGTEAAVHKLLIVK